MRDENSGSVSQRRTDNPSGLGRSPGAKRNQSLSLRQVVSNLGDKWAR
jgi:hypothetical protein